MKPNLPEFTCYGDYSSNYGIHALKFTTPNNDEFYYSYQTLVAFSTERSGLVCRKNVWKTTTGKHLNAIQPNKAKRVSKEEFERLYILTFPQ